MSTNAVAPMSQDRVSELAVDLQARAFFGELASQGIHPRDDVEAQRMYKCGSALLDKYLDEQQKAASAKDPLARLEKAAGISDQQVDGTASASDVRMAQDILNANPDVFAAVMSSHIHLNNAAA